MVAVGQSFTRGTTDITMSQIFEFNLVPESTLILQTVLGKFYFTLSASLILFFVFNKYYALDGNNYYCDCGDSQL